MPLQIRRGTEAERLAMTVPLAEGELLYVTDDQRLYLGGKTPQGVPILGGIPITGYTNEDAQDAAAALFSSGTHRSISFTYNDSLNKIDATVNLSAHDGHIVPDQNSVYDLGSSVNKFRDLYLSGSTIFLGDAQISSTGSAVNLPAGSTINGTVIESVGGVVAGSNYNINIVGDDSTLIVNSATQTVTATGGFFGNITGDIKGSLAGDDSTVLIDGTNNLVRANYDNGALSITSSSIVSSATPPIGLPSDSPVYFGSNTDPNTLWINSTENFAFFTGLTDGTFNSGFEFRMSRGSLTAPASLIAGDATAFVTGTGYNGSNYVTNGIFGLTTDLAWDGTPGGSGEIPGSFGAVVLDITGAQRVLTFDSRGVLNVPVAKTDVYSLAGTPLPSAVTSGLGARAFVSDANANTFATAYTGGGANSVPVYSDGSVWRIG